MNITKMALEVIIGAIVVLTGIASACGYQGPINEGRASSVLEAHRDSLDKLAGIIGREVAADTDGSYHILLTFASEQYIARHREQKQLPASLDGVPVEVGIANPSQAAETAGDSVLLTLTTDKAAYEPGEKVLIKASAKNLSSDSTAYLEGRAGGIPISILVRDSPTFPDEGVRLLEGGRKTSLVFPQIALGTDVIMLGPGDTAATETFWDQKLLGRGGEFDAPFGRYMVSSTVWTMVNPRVLLKVDILIWAGN